MERCIPAADDDRRRGDRPRRCPRVPADARSGLNPLGWTIAGAAIVGILVRPWRINEAWWAAGGAGGLLLSGGISPPAALAALGRGTDVYLFLVGMMLLAEFAGAEGVFGWAAMRAVRIAGRSRARLFALVYGAGIITTALLSNDATIVVLTPAVIDALRRYDAPVYPYVVICALVANAASFVLPISNPSNLLVFAGNIPGLGDWMRTFAVPSAVALAVTYLVARIAFRRDIAGDAAPAAAAPVAVPARVAIALLAFAAASIVITSAFRGPLGLATFACGCAAWLVASLRDRARLTAMPRAIAWPVVALTAALFVILAAVDAAGGFAATRQVLTACARLAEPWNGLATGAVVAAASNIVNNLPVGLNLGQTLPAMHAPSSLRAAALIGVNLGPNATVNGSLATVLWLAIVRRAGIAASPWTFARVGLATTVPALVATLLTIRTR